MPTKLARCLQAMVACLDTLSDPALACAATTCTAVDLDEGHFKLRSVVTLQSIHHKTWMNDFERFNRDTN